MRLNFTLSQNKDAIPFNYQNALLSRLHSWLGQNEHHDAISLYSFGNIFGRYELNGGLKFPKGANWFLSFWDSRIGKEVIDKIMKDPAFIYGMEIKSVEIQNDPNFGDNYKFWLSSPVLIRKYTEDGKCIHLTYKDSEADEYLTATMKRKLQQADLNDDVKVSFDKTYAKAKTKLIDINGIKNRASLCPVIIKGDPKSLQFAWNVGVGHSSGSGFGGLC